MRLWGTLKEEKEEEPEGEVLGESDTGSLLLPSLCFHFNLTSSFLYLFTLPLFFHNFSLLDDSKEGNEEERRPMTKEEEDVDILHSWMEVGGQPALPEGEAQGLLAEVSKFPCLFSISPSSFYPLFSFSDLLPILPSQSWCVRLLLAISSFFVGFETAPAVPAMKREEAKRLKVEALAARDQRGGGN